MVEGKLAACLLQKGSGRIGDDKVDRTVVPDRVPYPGRNDEDMGPFERANDASTVRTAPLGFPFGRMAETGYLAFGVLVLNQAAGSHMPEPERQDPAVESEEPVGEAGGLGLLAGAGRITTRAIPPCHDASSKPECVVGAWWSPAS
jgi:hypothetical protein